PGAALVNLTQTPIVAYPTLAAKFDDWGGASKQMLRALGDVRRGMGRKEVLSYAKGKAHPSLPANLTAEERLAFEAWTLAGARDVTRAHNLAGIGDTDSLQNNPVFNRSMGVISSAFHMAEVVNRDVTLLASYRLARLKGQGHAQAVTSADKVTTDSHLDYSNANRARYMQGNTAKLLLMFRSYSQGITYLLARSVFQAVKGEKPAVRREARQRLAGVLGMTFAFSGAVGMPMLGVGYAVANMVAALFGDDDEPWDAETEFRGFLHQALPAPLAASIDRGPVNALTGLDFASRVSLNELWIRTPNRDLDGAGLYQHIVEQLIGPIGGIASSPFTAADQLQEGHYHRALEAMSPKFVRDGLKAMRYAEDGVTTRRGDSVLPADEDLGAWGLVWQGMGLSPDKVRAAWETTNMLKNYERHVIDRRRTLQSAIALGIIEGDTEAVGDLMPRVRAWNAKMPEELRINSRTVRASVQSRQRYSEKAQSGVVLLPGLEDLRERVGVR
ncbi:MAG: PLxRFG domain-containing protein, partial [Thiohalocapsa sp.]